MTGYLGKPVRRGSSRILGKTPILGTGVLGRVPINAGERLKSDARFTLRPSGQPGDAGDGPVPDPDSGPNAPPVGGCTFGCPTGVHGANCTFDGQTQPTNPYCACCCIYDCGGGGIIADKTSADTIESG